MSIKIYLPNVTQGFSYWGRVVWRSGASCLKIGGELSGANCPGGELSDIPPQLMLSRTQVKSWITCNNSHITHMLNQILPWHKIIQHQACITNWRWTFSTVWHCEHFVLKILAPLVASPSGMSPIMFLNQQVQYLLRQIGLFYYIFV